MRAFVGYGSLGRQIDELVTEVKGPEPACYFDDLLYQREIAGAHRFEEFAAETFRDCIFYVCLGYRHLRKKADIIGALLQAVRRLPVACHGSVYLNRSSQLGAGTVVYPMANIDRDVYVGNGVLVNNSVVISHSTRVGDCTYLSPGVVLSGAVTIGKCTFIGTGAAVADGVTVGDDVVIGIGTVVTSDVPSGASVIGNPMRILSSKLRLSGWETTA